MATDLSQIIQDGLGSTLTGLLGKDTTFNEITKVDIRDINRFELLQVNSEFAFEKLTSLFEFFIPASSASIIFNTMMSAEDYDISATIDDDTADAIGEFVSNLCGSLVTAFNAENVEELGSSKFNIQHKEVLQGNSIENVDNFFRFSLNIEETPILIFIKFHDEFLPFIANIANSEVTFYPAEEPKEEENEPEEEIEEKQQEAPEEEKQEELEETKPESKVNKLLTKRNKIILGTLVGVIVLLILFSMLFSTEEPPMQETNTSKEKPLENNQTKPVEITPYKTLKKIDFSIKDIDIERLNNRLSTLTKYQVLSEQEIEEQKLADNLRLEKLQKERELIAFAKANKEEPIDLPIQEANETQELNTTEMTTNVIDKEQIQERNETTPQEVVVQTEEIVEKSAPEQMSLYYLSTYSIKYNLYKNLIQKNNSANTRISICNDKDGKTSIFIGPFQTDIEQMKMKTLIEKANTSIDTTLLQMTQEEFDQKCNF